VIEVGLDNKIPNPRHFQWGSFFNLLLILLLDQMSKEEEKE
jgi:hypothetical protein